MGHERLGADSEARTLLHDAGKSSLILILITSHAATAGAVLVSVIMIETMTTEDCPASDVP